MLQRVLGLFSGPLLIVGLCFIFYGEWGYIIGLFVGMAALVFIPIFGIITHVFQVKSLLPLLLIANAFPVIFWASSCLGRSCPNYSLIAASPQYFSATFCAFVVWLFVKKPWEKNVVIDASPAD